MQFKILRSELLTALNKVSRAVSNKSPLPVLTGIKFELNENSLVLTGSDSDITIQTFIPCDNDRLTMIRPGSVVLSGHYIFEIIRKIESEYIDIQIIDGTLTEIRGEQSHFNLNGIKAIDYPTIDLTKNGEHFKLDAYILKTIVSQTVFATSVDESRPILTGLNLRAKDGKLTCLATDSYRLARKVINIDENLSFNITIPAKSLIEISRIIEKVEDINLYVSDRKLLFVLGPVTMLTRLIDGAFPDTNRLVPESFLYELTVSSHDLTGAIGRASLLTNDANNIVKLSMNENEVIISSESQEIGSVKEKIESAFYTGSPLKIAFSSKYVIDAIRAISQDKIKISFNGDMRPFVITSEKDESILQLILPVRTFQ